MSDLVYLLWSNKHGMWWKAAEWGYTPNIDEAGRYSEGHALECVVRSAMSGRLDQVSCMVAAPDNWTRPERDKAHDIAEDARRDDARERSQR